ncbi:hypothetical protein AMR42_15105 [Limnothrix sp. PR1529]|uniref:ATP-binding protein n=1 Tax=Limnothrix sp. PR1529 TaxID=1704291 RepID=UPI000C14B6ED|nr:ATP-binding protein [Limnothrix sp. PR1529]PIB06280.1 hypothetical protein AMR42_15105 [Limnothrix sp. PR1529]
MAFIRRWMKGDREYRAIVKSVWSRERKRSEQQVLKWLGRVDLPAEKFFLSSSLRGDEEKFLLEAVERRRSLLVHGEWGVGKSYLAQRLAQLIRDSGGRSHYEPWSTPAGGFVRSVAEAVGVETETEEGKRRTQAEILGEIGPALVESQTVLLIDKAHNIPVAVRNSIEQWLETGAQIYLFATTPKRADMWLKFPRWELRPFSPEQSIKLITAAADHHRVQLDRDRARELATLANGNPQFLIRSVLEHDLAIESPADQNEWIDGTPLVIAGLALLLVIRYLGQGMGDRNLIIMGGIASVLIRVTVLWTGRVSKRSSKV